MPTRCRTITLDPTGRLADLYDVQDLAWCLLTDAQGHVPWTSDGWASTADLEAAARKAPA